MILTIHQIRNLAAFAGLVVTPDPVDDTQNEKETEIAVAPCPPQGVKDEDDESIIHCQLVAYFEEYPEEGVYPLD